LQFPAEMFLSYELQHHSSDSTTHKLCEYTTLWNTVVQNYGWTLQLLSCILINQ